MLCVQRWIIIYKRIQYSPNSLRNSRKLHFFYDIVDSFVIDMCSKLIFCSKIAQKGKILPEVARSSKSCSKSQKLPKSCRAQSGQVYSQANFSGIPESGFTYMKRGWNAPLIVESDALYFKRDKCAKQTNKKNKKQQEQ